MLSKSSNKICSYDLRLLQLMDKQRRKGLLRKQRRYALIGIKKMGKKYKKHITNYKERVV